MALDISLERRQRPTHSSAQLLLWYFSFSPSVAGESIRARTSLAPPLRVILSREDGEGSHAEQQVTRSNLSELRTFEGSLASLGMTAC
jgi:hypothetical protein